jgi:ABC-type multidrug transport system fused ATPase/permease subunit
MLSRLFAYFTQAHLEKRLSLLPIDFSKPWWQIIWDQKVRGIFVFTGLSISYVFSTQLPLYLGYIFENHRPDLFAVLAVCWLGLYFFEYFVRLTNTVFQVHCIHSIYFAAHQFFLKVDPIFHSERSSGVVINKTQRASQAYEDLLDSFTSNGMLEMFIGAITVIVTFFSTNNILGVIALLTVIILVSSNLILFHRTVPKQEYAFLEADDKLKAAAVENLTQIFLIRSSFATNEALHRLHERNKAAMDCEAFFWKSFVDIRAGLKIFMPLLSVLLAFISFNWLTMDQFHQCLPPPLF